MTTHRAGNAIAEFLDRIINYCLLRANGSTPAVMTFPRNLWGEAKNIPFGILHPDTLTPLRHRLHLSILHTQTHTRRYHPLAGDRLHTHAHSLHIIIYYII